MIATLSKYLTACTLLLAFTTLSAQGPFTPDTIKIPADFKPEFNRLRNHELIDAEQKAILASDGKADKFFTPSANDETNFFLTAALMNQVDRMQYSIETDSLFDHRLKVNYLKGLENVLHYFRQNWKIRSDKKVNPANLPIILEAYQECVKKDHANESIQSIVSNLPFGAGMPGIDATDLDGAGAPNVARGHGG